MRLILALLLAPAPSMAAPPARPPECPAAAADAGASAISSCLRDLGCRRTLVVSHRGLGYGHPENSRAGARACVEAGVPIIEVDLQVAKDGEIFVLHDAGLDRTTTMKGSISRYGAQELEAALLDNGEPLPKFTEMYALVRGRAVLNLHFKDNAVEVVADWIARCGSFDDVIFQMDKDSFTRAAGRAKSRHPRMIVMPEVRDWDDLDRAERLLGGRPDIVKFTGPVSTDLPMAVHDRGMKLFTNAFVHEGNGSWGDRMVDDLAASGVDFLQTNKPAWLMGRLSRTKP